MTARATKLAIRNLSAIALLKSNSSANHLPDAA